MTQPSTLRRCLLAAAVSASCLHGIDAAAAPSAQAERHAAVISHWSAARRAAAEPRDLRIDSRGLAYLRRADGSLQPHGHRIEAIDRPAPMAKPGSGTNTPSSFSSRDPAAGATIGASKTFSATVTDNEGVRSVSFVLVSPSGATQTTTAATAGGNVWTASLSGFTDGAWQWRVVARDLANVSTTSPTTSFTVSTGSGGGGGGGSTVANAAWTQGGAVQTAVGRIYFEMPSNSRRTRWAGYVCSGTVATDATTGRSIIQTASHCVYDDAYKAFARNVLFIPNQDGTTGAGTDRDCTNDPLGCWSTAFGVVDLNWTTRTFPDNIPWDYAYYVVSDAGAHSGNGAGLSALDTATGSLPLSFAAPQTGSTNTSAYTHGMGYSYSDDPNFMYCAENMVQFDAVNWQLASCGLSGGSSGGPWIQPLATNGGTGPIVSVNSWGYTNQPGMYGPKLAGTSASCVFAAAQSTVLGSVPTTAGDAGVVKTCP